MPGASCMTRWLGSVWLWKKPSLCRCTPAPPPPAPRPGQAQEGQDQRQSFSASRFQPACLPPRQCSGHKQPCTGAQEQTSYRMNRGPSLSFDYVTSGLGKSGLFSQTTQCLSWLLLGWCRAHPLHRLGFDHADSTQEFPFTGPLSPR